MTCHGVETQSGERYGMGRDRERERERASERAMGTGGQKDEAVGRCKLIFHSILFFFYVFGQSRICRPLTHTTQRFPIYCFSSFFKGLTVSLLQGRFTHAAKSLCPHQKKIWEGS